MMLPDQDCHKPILRHGSLDLAWGLCCSIAEPRSSRPRSWSWKTIKYNIATQVLTSKSRTRCRLDAFPIHTRSSLRASKGFAIHRLHRPYHLALLAILWPLNTRSNLSLEHDSSKAHSERLEDWKSEMPLKAGNKMGGVRVCNGRSS